MQCMLLVCSLVDFHYSASVHLQGDVLIKCVLHYDSLEVIIVFDKLFIIYILCML